MSPIHLHFLFFISFSMAIYLVHFQRVVLETLYDHFKCKILRRHLLMKVCILFTVFCVLRHVSDRLSQTALTFELNILSIVLILICFAVRIVLNMMNATLAFCILALTSSFVPPCLLIVLPRYVNESVSASGSPF